MGPKKIILDELEQASPWLAKRAPGHPFSVPDNYFLDLAGIILRRVRAGEIENAEEETQSLSPLLRSIGKQMPYSTPSGYFESLANDVSKQLPVGGSVYGSHDAADAPSSELNHAPVVRMHFRQRVLRYAAAAAVVAALVVTGWFYFGSPSADSSQLAQTGNGNAIPVPDQVSEISDSEISEYLDYSAGLITYETIGDEPAELQPDDIGWLLADYPDQELESYLQWTGAINQQFN